MDDLRTGHPLLRDIDGGMECPECKHFESGTQGALPPEFDGPSIRSW
ncbi:hypothetical protein [Microbacterium aerolatum]